MTQIYKELAMKNKIFLSIIIILSFLNLIGSFSFKLFGAGGGGGKACTASASCEMPMFSMSCSCPASGGSCLGSCKNSWAKVECSCTDPNYNFYDTQFCSKCGTGGSAS